jgi:hypothetical protein
MSEKENIKRFHDKAAKEFEGEPDQGYEYNTEYKKAVEGVFGRRRGQGYRSDREWNAALFPGSKQNMAATVEHVKTMGQLQSNKGWTEKKDLKYVGTIPVEIQYANPELWDDEEYVRKFFKEFHDFKVNTD